MKLTNIITMLAIGTTTILAAPRPVPGDNDIRDADLASTSGKRCPDHYYWDTFTNPNNPVCRPWPRGNPGYADIEATTPTTTDKTPEHVARADVAGPTWSCDPHWDSKLCPHNPTPVPTPGYMQPCNHYHKQLKDKLWNVTELYDARSKKCWPIGITNKTVFAGDSPCAMCKWWVDACEKSQILTCTSRVCQAGWGPEECDKGRECGTEYCARGGD